MRLTGPTTEGRKSKREVCKNGMKKRGILYLSIKVECGAVEKLHCTVNSVHLIRVIVINTKDDLWRLTLSQKPQCLFFVSPFSYYISCS